MIPTDCTVVDHNIYIFCSHMFITDGFFELYNVHASAYPKPRVRQRSTKEERVC